MRFITSKRMLLKGFYDEFEANFIEQKSKIKKYCECECNVSVNVSVSVGLRCEVIYCWSYNYVNHL
jgi:hypothetical protein